MWAEMDGERPARTRARRLGAEGAVNLGIGQSALAGNRPRVALDTDDRRSQRTARITCIQDKRQAFAKLFNELRNIGTGRSTRKIRARTSNGPADGFDQCRNDLRIRPAQGHPAGVACNLEGQPVRRLHNESQGARPELVGERKKRVGNVACEQQRLLDGLHQNRKRASLGPSLQLKDALDGIQIERIRTQTVERVGGRGDYATALDETSGIADEMPLRRFGGDLEDFSWQFLSTRDASRIRGTDYIRRWLRSNMNKRKTLEPGWNFSREKCPVMQVL